MTFEKPTGRETRIAADAWPEEDFEIRASGEGMTFSGYAAVFDKWSEDMGGWREKIAPGAFSRSLKSGASKVRMFVNHDWGRLLATVKAGTLRLMEDDRGLLVSADLPDTSDGRDLATLLARRDVDGMSFGFQAVKDEWAGDSKNPERTLTEIRLFEVSPVTAWPAYPATSAYVRTLAEIVEAAPDELSAALRALVAEEQITPEQRDLLIRAINKRGPGVVGGRLAARLADFRGPFAA